MPELPEVETVRQGFAPLILNKTVANAWEVRWGKIINGDSAQFANDLVGLTFRNRSSRQIFIISAQ